MRSDFWLTAIFFIADSANAEDDTALDQSGGTFKFKSKHCRNLWLKINAFPKNRANLLKLVGKEQALQILPVYPLHLVKE